VKLVNKADTYNFTRGMPVAWNEGSGTFVPATRLQRFRSWLFAVLRSVARRPRMVVSEIDRDEGRITMVAERWSWLRWRWERTS